MVRRWGPFDDEHDAVQGARAAPLRLAPCVVVACARARPHRCCMRAGSHTRTLSHAALLRALEAEALPRALAARLAAGEAGAAEARARYLQRNRRAYVSRVAAAAAARFAPWTPRGGAAAALADVAAAERQHASLRRLGARGAAANDAAQQELVRGADDGLEEALLEASWAMQGHADEAAPAPTLVAGVGLALARAGTPPAHRRARQPPRDLPPALPPCYPEARAAAAAYKRAHTCKHDASSSVFCFCIARCAGAAPAGAVCHKGGAGGGGCAGC
jgi:hypothetical protein